MDRETIAYFTFSFVFALCFVLCLRSYLRRRAQRRIAVIRIEDEAVDRILRALYSILADGAVVRGLEPAVVNSIPTFPYHSTAAAPEHHHECAVCLSEFEENERLRLLPKCGHFFHSKCVDKWFLSATTCPLCRTVVEAVVLNQDEDPASMAAEPAEEEIAIEPSEPADEEMGLGPVEPDDEEMVELISRSTGRTWRLIFRRRRLG